MTIIFENIILLFVQKGSVFQIFLISITSMTSKKEKLRNAPRPYPTLGEYWLVRGPPVLRLHKAIRIDSIYQ